jgi:hypothetical protein
MTDSRTLLGGTPVGRRFIAMMMIYNNQNLERLRTFIGESFSPTLLEEASVEERLQAFVDQYEAHGKVRVQQVIVSEKHNTSLLLQAQKTDAFFYVEFVVQDDYPHHILRYLQQAMTDENSQEAAN